MKKFACLFAFLFAGLVFAKDVKIEPTITDFKEFIVISKLIVESADKEESYKNMILKNKDTGKMEKFVDLPKLDRTLIVLYKSEEISVKLGMVYDTWKKMYSHMAEISPEGTEKSDARLPTKKELTVFMEGLMKLRKEQAVRFESFVEKTMKEIKDGLPEEEKAAYIKRIKAWHDNQKLIERK